jgi:hypothetical protein
MGVGVGCVGGVVNCASTTGAAVRGLNAHMVACVVLTQVGWLGGHRGDPTVGKAGQGARVGRQMLLVMHATCPPLPLQIVVDVYVAQPGPL